jgi:hypothetical protein
MDSMVFTLAGASGSARRPAASRGWSEAMEDPAELLIRRALGRRPPPKLGPTLAEDVLRRVAESPPPAVSGRRAIARRWLAGAVWLAVAGASTAVLVHVEWAGGARAAAWALALAAIPLAYSATLWPDRALVLLALCGEALAPRR